MRSAKDIFKNLVIFTLLIVITMMVIFHTYKLENIIEVILNAKLIYIILGLIIMLLYFLIESYNIKRILKLLGDKVSILKCLKYTLIGSFFSGITPATTGGQPMEIYTMHKEKIPVSHSALSLLIHLGSFQFISIFGGIICAIINHNMLSDGYIYLFIIGVSLNLIAFSTEVIGVFFPKLAKKIVNLIIKLLKKLKISSIENNIENINKVLDDYSNGAKFIKSNKKVLFQSILIALLQVLVFHSVPFMVYKALGLTGYSYLKLVSIQTMFYVSISSIPLPGTVGISEGAGFKVYSNIFGPNLLPSAILLIRTINFYFFILVGLIVFLFNLIKKRE
jgi:uncharacterized protein (TIRG00374 family)